jgi:hypothetical protein
MGLESASVQEEPEANSKLGLRATVDRAEPGSSR